MKLFHDGELVKVEEAVLVIVFQDQEVVLGQFAGHYLRARDVDIGEGDEFTGEIGSSKEVGHAVDHEAESYLNL